MVPISITAVNLVMGPATLYVGAFGSAEPTDASITPNGVSTPPSTPPWTDCGGTDGGVNFEVDTTYTDLVVDQITMSVGARLTDTKITVTAKLSEITLANVNQALNAISTVSAGSGYSTLDIPVGQTPTQPTYAALIIDGWAPFLSSGAPARRRIIVRKVLSQTKVGLMYDRKTQQGLDCTFTAYYVSGSIPPVHLTDQQA